MNLMTDSGPIKDSFYEQIFGREISLFYDEND